MRRILFLLPATALMSGFLDCSETTGGGGGAEKVELDITPPKHGKILIYQGLNSVGVQCPGSSCYFLLDPGREVGLVPVPDEGFKFSQWSGCGAADQDQCNRRHPDAVGGLTFCIVSNVGPCTAEFEELPAGTAELIVRVQGAGSVSTIPAITNCEETSCSSVFDIGTEVVLDAQPMPNSTFIGWTGDCADSPQRTTVEIKGATNCTAQFTSGPDVQLTIRSLSDPNTVITEPRFASQETFIAVAEVQNPSADVTYSFIWRVLQDDGTAVLVRNPELSGPAVDWQEIQLDFGTSIIVEVSDGSQATSRSVPIQISAPPDPFTIRVDTANGGQPLGTSIDFVVEGGTGNPIAEDLAAEGKEVTGYEWMFLYEGLTQDEEAIVSCQTSMSQCYTFPSPGYDLQRGAAVTAILDRGAWRVIVKVMVNGEVAPRQSDELGYRFVL